jgi:hypothetical protein
MCVGTAATVLTTMVVGCATQKAAPPPPPVVTSSVSEKPGQVVEKASITVAAKVVKVDQKDRVVTLRNATGETFDVEVGEEVKNLPQVKKGDDVIVTYYEQMAISVRKKGEAKPGVQSGEGIATAEPGEKPAAIAAHKTALTATVVRVNRGDGTITLKGEKGNIVTVKAREPRRLEGIKPGDLIEVEYTAAVAVSVEKPGTP